MQASLMPSCIYWGGVLAIACIPAATDKPVDQADGEAGMKNEQAQRQAEQQRRMAT